MHGVLRPHVGWQGGVGLTAGPTSIMAKLLAWHQSLDRALHNKDSKKGNYKRRKRKREGVVRFIRASFILSYIYMLCFVNGTPKKLHDLVSNFTFKWRLIVDIITWATHPEYGRFNYVPATFNYAAAQFNYVVSCEWYWQENHTIRQFLHAIIVWATRLLYVI